MVEGRYRYSIYFKWTQRNSFPKGIFTLFTCSPSGPCVLRFLTDHSLTSQAGDKDSINTGWICHLSTCMHYCYEIIAFIQIICGLPKPPIRACRLEKEGAGDHLTIILAMSSCEGKTPLNIHLGCDIPSNINITDVAVI